MSTAPQNTYFTDFQDTLTTDWISSTWKPLVERARALTSGDDDATVAAWVDLLTEVNEVSSHVRTHVAHTGLAFRVDSLNDEVVAAYRHYTDELHPLLDEIGAEFSELVLAADALPQLEATFGDLWRNARQVQVDAFDVRNETLKTDLEERLIDDTQLHAHATITVGGEELPISHARRFADSRDHNERRESFASMTGWFEDNRDELESIMDDAIDLRRRMANNVAAPSFVEMRYREMRRYDYDRDDVARFRAAIRKHIVPVAERLRQQQAEALVASGTPASPNGAHLVHPADVAHDPGADPELIVGIDEQLPTASRVFNEMSPVLGSIFDQAVADERIDLAARDGKMPGAFCTSFSDQRVPFVVCNSVGTADDVRTLVHEFGHAFQVQLSGHIDLLELRSTTSEVAEIHSMSLELLTLPHMQAFFGDDAAAYGSNLVRSSMLRVPYMASVDEFQHQLYPADGEAPDRDGRGDIWQDVTRTYMPGIDWDAEPFWLQHRWLGQRHIVHWPFYYIDYALAELTSVQIWLNSLEDEDAALEQYLELCRRGGSLGMRELYEASGLELPFADGMVERLVERLMPHLGLAETVAR